MYQLLSGKTIKLRLACIWVKCGFLSAATSAFYTFKIRRSPGPHFTPGPVAVISHTVKDAIRATLTVLPRSLWQLYYRWVKCGRYPALLPCILPVVTPAPSIPAGPHFTHNRWIRSGWVPAEKVSLSDNATNIRAYETTKTTKALTETRRVLAWQSEANHAIMYQFLNNNKLQERQYQHTLLNRTFHTDGVSKQLCSKKNDSDLDTV